MKRSTRRAPRATPDGFEPAQISNRAAEFQPASYNADAHTVEAVFAAGVRRPWFGILEELAIAPEAIDLTRIPLGQVRFLDSHDQSSINAVLGTVISARIENGLLVGTIRFAESEAARAAEAMVARGDVNGISVGYRVTTWALIAVENDIEIWQAQRWELLEVSLVAVPADPAAVIRSAASPQRATIAQTQEQDDMRRNAAAGGAPATTAAAAPAAAAPVTAAAPAAAAEPVRAAEPVTHAAPAAAAPVDPSAVVRAERARVAQINEIGRRAGLEAATIDAAIAGDTTVDAFRATAFDALAARSGSVTVDPSRISITRDEAETRRRGMTDALVFRLSMAGRRVGEAAPVLPDHARAFANLGIVEMAAECVGHRGSLYRARQVEDVMQRAMMTVSDFPAIFQDAINRRLLSRYTAAMPAYRFVAARYLAGDFRVGNVVRAGDFPQLQPVTETGEIKQGKFSESKETIQVKPYGVGFNLSRQMIINDNLGAIDQVLGSYGDSVTDWENGQVMALVVANPTLLTDTTAVFEASKHKNYDSSGSAISVTSVGVGRAKMSKQTSLDGLVLDIEPAIMLTSPDKRTEAEQLVATITPAQTTSAVPDSMKRIVPISSGKLTGNGWYLFADVNVAPCFMYALLEGFEGPRLTLDQKFGTQGLGVQLEHDFGASAIDYRGGYKNAGA